MKIILTGASGLIGSRFHKLTQDRHEIIPLTSKDVTITVIDSVDLFFSNQEADVVIHMAAKTDVDKCEKDKKKDQEIIKKNIGGQFEVEKMRWSIGDLFGRESAFAVNFYGTKNIYDAAKEKRMKFVYISTDFVFGGKDKYDENSKPSPLNWYGMTKYFGERIIDTSEDLIVRISFPYGYKNPLKKDFFWTLFELLNNKKEVDLIEDETFTPTFIDDIVFGIEFLLSKNASGVFHLTGSSFEDPYKIGMRIKDKFRLTTKINPTTRDKIYKQRATRPFQSIMKNDKIKHLGFEPKAFSEGFDLITNI